MGRMKEFCIDIINANGGIPEGITIADVVRMKELDMYNWEEYERDQEKRRLQFIKSENSGETAKMEQASEIFRESAAEHQEQKDSE
jgi:hypothetical protein